MVLTGFLSSLIWTSRLDKEAWLDRHVLDDEQWKRVAPLLPGKAGDPGRTGADNRVFLEAVLWIARTGAPWRDLPDSLRACKVMG